MLPGRQSKRQRRLPARPSINNDDGAITAFYSDHDHAISRRRRYGITRASATTRNLATDGQPPIDLWWRRRWRTRARSSGYTAAGQRRFLARWRRWFLLRRPLNSRKRVDGATAIAWRGRYGRVASHAGVRR